MSARLLRTQQPRPQTNVHPHVHESRDTGAEICRASMPFAGPLRGGRQVGSGGYQRGSCTAPESVKARSAFPDAGLPEIAV